MSAHAVVRLRCSQNRCRSGRIPCPCWQACMIPEQEPKISPRRVARTNRVIYGGLVVLVVVLGIVALAARVVP